MPKTSLQPHNVADGLGVAPHGLSPKAVIGPKLWATFKSRSPSSPAPASHPATERMTHAAAQTVCAHLGVRPSRPLRRTRIRSIPLRPTSAAALPSQGMLVPAEPLSDVDPRQAPQQALLNIIQPYAEGRSPGEDQNEIRQRVTRFDHSKGQVDTVWMMGLVLDLTFNSAFQSAGGLAGVVAWVSNVRDFRLADDDETLTKEQYQHAQAHRRVSIQAWKDLASYVAAHPDDPQAADLLIAMAEVVKLIDGVLNSYENFYKPPTEAGLRQEGRLRQHKHLLKLTEGIRTGRQQDPVHTAELALLETHANALPLGRKERRESLARLRGRREAIEQQLMLDQLSDDTCEALTKQLAGLDQDIKLLEDHRKAVARPLVLRKAKYFGQKRAKLYNTRDSAYVRIPLDVANAGLAVTSIVPQIAAASVDAAIGLPIAGAITTGLSAAIGHRAADFEAQEAKKEKELHRRNIAACYQRITSAQRLLDQLKNCPDSPQVRMQRKALLNQIGAQVRFLAQSKASVRMAQVRHVKQTVMRHINKLQIAAAVAAVTMGALAVPAAGAALTAVGLLATTTLVAFLAYVVYNAKWREKSISQKLLRQQLAFEHACKVLGPQAALNLGALPADRVALIATALQAGAAPQLKPFLTAEKLQGGNPFFTIEWMAQAFHQASQDRQAGKDVQLKDYPGAVMAKAMGLPPGTAEYLFRGGQLFDAEHPVRHLDECRKIIAGNLFQLPVANAEQLPSYTAPHDLLASPEDDSHLGNGEPDALSNPSAFTLLSPPAVVPQEISPEQVAVAIRDAGKKEWARSTFHASMRPRDSAKQLMKQHKQDGVSPKHWGRIVAQLKENLPRDPQTKQFLVPEPYASVDAWLSHELPKTAARAAETGQAFQLIENTGQDKQRQSTQRRYQDLAAVTAHCAQWLTKPAAAA